MNLKFSLHAQIAIGTVSAFLNVSSASGSAKLPLLQPPVVKVPTFYATDRSTITSNQDPKGVVLSELALGCATAMLPPSEEWFQDGKALKREFASMGWTVDDQTTTVAPFIEVRGYVAEPNPERVLTNVGPCSDFWRRLRVQAEASRQKAVFVYIHGFASSGNNAVYSAGILSSRVEAPVIAFTWPSQGSAGLRPLRLIGKERMRARYQADRQMIDDPRVLAHLTAFLQELKNNISPDTKVNLVAHSLGNRLLAKYLASGADDLHFDDIYFLAADVDEDLFMSALKRLPQKAKHSIVYVNPKDRVLKISAANNLLGLKFARKLGHSDFPVPGVEFINYREIAEPKSLDYLRAQHYIPFEHFGSIYRTGMPYQSKTDNQFFLLRQTNVERKKHR